MFPDHSFDPKICTPINDVLDINNTIGNNGCIDKTIKDNKTSEDQVKVVTESDKSNSNFTKSAGVLAGIGVAASIIAVVGVTLLDAA